MDLNLILKRKYSEFTWAIDGNTYDGIIWLSETQKPSEEELVAHWKSVSAEIIAEKEHKISARLALLERLGISEEEAKLLLS